MIPDDIRARIEGDVEATYGWKGSEIRIEPLGWIRMPLCSFYVVTHTELPVTHPPGYALLPGDQLVGSHQADAAIRILDACARRSEASADSWAEVLTWFHPEVAPGSVLYQRDFAETQVQAMEAAGTVFAPPSFVPGQAGAAVRFCMTTPWTLFHVEAARHPDGTLQVDKTGFP